MQNSKCAENVMVINLSPYDGWLEKAALTFHLNKPGHRMHSLSLTTDAITGQHSEKLLAMHLMEDRNVFLRTFAWCISQRIGRQAGPFWEKACARTIRPHQKLNS